MTAFDPALCARLVAEAREDDEQMTAGEWIGGADCVSVYKDKHERGAGTVIAEMIEPERHEANASAIARTRNNLAAMADQLEAALREVARMTADVTVAAGECLVPVDEMPPGSHLRRVVLANRMWRYERDRLTAERDAVQTAIDVEAKDIAQGLKKHLAVIESAFNEATASLAHEVTRRENAEREVERLESMLDAVTEPERDL